MTTSGPSTMNPGSDALSNLLLRLQPLLDEPVLQPVSAEHRKQVSFWQSRIIDDKGFCAIVLGRQKAGKSTLLNALLGRAYLPMGGKETTARPIVIHKGPKFELRILGPSIDRTALEKLIKGVDGFSIDEQTAIRSNSASVRVESVKALLHALSSPSSENILKIDHAIDITLPDIDMGDHITLIDTPGSESANPLRDTIGAEQRYQAPGFILAIHGNALPKKIEYERIAGYLNQRQQNALVVLNARDIEDGETKGEWKWSIRNGLNSAGINEYCFCETSGRHALLSAQIRNAEIRKIDEILNLEPAVFTLKKAIALGADLDAWSRELEESGNIKSIKDWLIRQSLSHSQFHWIAREALLLVLEWIAQIHNTIGIAQRELSAHKDGTGSRIDDTEKENVSLHNAINKYTDMKSAIIHEFNSRFNEFIKEVHDSVDNNSGSMYFSYNAYNNKILTPLYEYLEAPEEIKNISDGQYADYDKEVMRLFYEYLNDDVVRPINIKIGKLQEKALMDMDKVLAELVRTIRLPRSEPPVSVKLSAQLTSLKYKYVRDTGIGGGLGGALGIGAAVLAGIPVVGWAAAGLAAAGLFFGAAAGASVAHSQANSRLAQTVWFNTVEGIKKEIRTLKSKTESDLQNAKKTFSDHLEEIFNKRLKELTDQRDRNRKIIDESSLDLSKKTEFLEQQIQTRRNLLERLEVLERELSEQIPSGEVQK